MAEEIKLSGQRRTVSGTGEARRLRRGGWLPCILNTQDGQAVSMQLNDHDFEVLLQHHVGENLIISLTVGDDQSRTVLLKDVQHDPVSGHPLHADFLEISMTEKMRVSIPIELVGEPAGVVEGGVLEQPLRELEVECLPTDLVDSIEVDVSGLQIGESLAVGDVTWNAAFDVLSMPELAVAAVAVPREEEEEEAAVEEGAEPEVIGEKTAEEEAEEEESGE